MREDTGEIQSEANSVFRNCWNLIPFKGALHNHTVVSDGEATLEQMADAAQALGWTWLGIADHSPTLKVANGAPADRLLEQGQKFENTTKTGRMKG